MSGWVTGDTGVILIEQGSGTTYTVTLPGGSVVIGGSTYTTTTTSGGTDVLGVYYDGTSYYWSIPGGGVGEKGATGATGTGEKGATGTGEKGATGTGEKGATGTGEKGAQGTTGLKGEKGAQGTTGTKGEKGEGEKGAQGADGGSGTTIGSSQVAFSNGTNLIGESDFTYDTVKNTLTVDKIKVGNASGTILDGMIRAENDIVAFSTSDKRLKENIKPIENALAKIQSISGNNFTWKPLITKEEKTIHANEGPDVGVIAQEIEAILPELVTTRDNGYKAVNYEKIVALLIEAIKEQQGEIDELKRKINE